MALPGRKHRYQVSTTLADGSGSGHTGSSVGEEDTNGAWVADGDDFGLAFNVREGHNTQPPGSDFYDFEEEAGQSTHLIDETTADSPLVLSKGGTKSISVAADDKTLGHMLYFASHGGTKATSTELPAASGLFEQTWTGPATDGTVQSFTAVDVGEPASDVAAHNIVFPNCVYERVSLQGRAKQPLILSADVRTGGEESTEFEVATDLKTPSRDRLFHFGHVFLMAGDNLNGNVDGSDFDFTTYPVDDDALFGATGSPVPMAGTSNLTPHLREFTLDLTQSIDDVNSYTAGNYDATSYAQIVKWNDDWSLAPEAQQLELEMVLLQAETTDTSGTGNGASATYIRDLRALFRDGTTQAFCLYIIHPNKHATQNAWYGAACAFTAKPVDDSWREENDGFNNRLIRCRWRAIYDTDNSNGWSFNVVTPFEAELGDNA